ncbi:probable beta-tubulin polyglutamylase isoform X1 [Ruditapes philippinarum]|uniref:probable beta-tubulin polyglutamylase isoform X1 n=2 Tax=Ruditapes philippinarum TaxID=129788 RepID=UPI00295B5C13|nr:probable beta-tubulin polyglutamylase isoform X1 [Ruditapes philippinarum]
MADSDQNLTVSKQENAVHFKYTTYETNYIVTDNKADDNISLQEAFKRYREAKQDELRQARLLKKRQELRKADPHKMAALRQKFVNQAKKYFGYPYARKYWPPDSPEYKSKLFLDCCGLVRRVMRDLADDFGFILGPWNQAYMFDTLPIVVKSEKDMKPGDLVFISATYYNPKSKKQRHNMTHVEIWAGDGCKTIGARWNNGKVQVWDSYKFTAKSYHSETYHFRSIDTWLKGLCTSHCHQHTWRRSKYSPTKKSIFALPEQVEEEDEAAGDDDDMVDSFNMRGNTFINQVSSVSKMLSQCEISEMKRPKTELDSPYSRINTPGASLNDTDAEFPIIRNNMKGKGKGFPVRREKTNLGLATKRQRNYEEVTPRNGDDKLIESNKDQVQLTLTSSLNDLGRKGFYLKDLVDSHKEESDDVNDMEGEFEEEDNEQEPEEFDYDDDYFIFANDDDSDDDEEIAGKSSDTQEQSSKSTEDSKGESVDSTIEKGKEDGAIEGDNKKNSAAENDNDQDENIIASSNGANIVKDQNKKLVNVIETVLPFGPEERSKSVNKLVHFDNANLNSNPKVAEKHQPKEKPRGQFLKASIITVVSKPEVSSPAVLSGNQSSCVSESQANTGNGCRLSMKASTHATSSSGSSSKSPLDSQKAVPQMHISEKQASSDSSTGSQSSSKSGSSSYTDSQASSSVSTQELVSSNETSTSDNCQSDSTSSSFQSGSKTDEDIENQAQSNLIGAKEQSSNQSVTDTDTSDSSEVRKERSKSEKDDGKRASEVRTTKLPMVSATNRPLFYVGNGNGASLVEGPLTSLGWKKITDRRDGRFKLKWVQCKSTIDYSSFREGNQLVNHIPNSQLLTNKLGLLNSLKSYERITLSTKGRLPRLKMTEFHPETYRLDDKTDREEFLRTYKESEIWICKPTGLNQGKGIFLIRSRKEVDEILNEQEQKKQQSKKPGLPVMNRIVQRYITNPLLLEGRKFDVRAYMLIASTVPFLILFHQGYVRLCCHEYEADNMDLGRHLTNQFVQKKNPNYEELKESTAWSMDRFNQYVNENVRPDCPVEIEEDWVYNTFTKQMQKIMIHLFNSVKHRLQSRIGYFDLFGLDFMVDTNMKIYVIEVNTNPALTCNCEALQGVIPGVVEETLYLAIECFEKSKRNKPLFPLKSLKDFTVLYCGSDRQTSPEKPQLTRSATRIQENNSPEKPKLAGQSSEKVPTLPSLYGLKRQSTQSMSGHTSADKRQYSDKQDSAAKKNLQVRKESNEPLKNENSDSEKNGKEHDVENYQKSKASDKERIENDSTDVHSDKKLPDIAEAQLKVTETLDDPKSKTSRGSRGNLERGN